VVLMRVLGWRERRLFHGGGVGRGCGGGGHGGLAVAHEGNAGGRGAGAR
jgi:hypothetical protein